MQNFLYVHQAWLVSSMILVLLGLAVYLAFQVGVFSVAPPAFAAVGAYASAVLDVKYGVPLAVSVVVALLFCAVLSLLVGLAAMHLRGVYFALATLAMVELVSLLISSLGSVTGGVNGMAVPGRVGVGVIAAVLVVVLVLCAIVSRLPLGRAATAIREARGAARMSGIPARRIEIGFFVASGVVAGTAGVLGAFSSDYLSPSSYQFSLTVQVLTLAVVGGVTVWLGPLVGGVIMLWLGEFLTIDPNLLDFIYGAVLVVVAVAAPRGLVLEVSRVARRVRRRTVAGEGGGAPGTEEAVMDHDSSAAGALPGPSELGPVVLEANELRKKYAGVTAVDGVSFDVHAGEILGVIGANGAGKSTLLNLLSAVAVPESGSVLIAGRRMKRHSVDRFVGAGVSRTFQLANVFSELSVRQNLELAIHRRRRLGRSAFLSDAGADDEVVTLLRLVGLDGLEANAPGAGLPYGVVRRLELARAVALAPSIVLLDEPLAGLGASEVGAVGRCVDLLAASGAAVVLVEHNAGFVFERARRVLALSRGSLLALGTPDEIRSSEAVRRAYLG